MPKYQFKVDHKVVKGAKYLAGEVHELAKEFGDRLVRNGWARPVKEVPAEEAKAGEQAADERTDAEREADKNAAKAREEAAATTEKPDATTNKTTRRTPAKAPAAPKVEESDPDSDF